MSWRGFGRSRGGPYSGRGPFSYLPPWQRPGWLYGRGACWWLFNPYAQANIPQNLDVVSPTSVPATPFAPMLTKEQEAAMLENQAKLLEQTLEQIRKRLEELKK